MSYLPLHVAGLFKGAASMAYSKSPTRTIRLFIFLLLSIFIMLPAPVLAQEPSARHQVVVYLFWGEGCPHCARAKPFLESLQVKYPEIVLREFEVYYNQENKQIFTSMAEKYGLEQLFVPTIFIGKNYQQGYSEELNPYIENAIADCLQNGCIDPGEGVEGVVPISTPPSLLPTPTAPPANQPPAEVNHPHTITLPLIGSVDLAVQPITLSTILIAFVDGFNPCSLWVLSMLLAITLHSGSRKKILIIGLIFLSVTAFIYAIFITGLFSILKITSFAGWIRILVSLVALFFAVVNIKDYFWYREGLSFTIAADQKPGIFHRMRRLMDAGQSFWGLAGATVVLAAGVSLVEFSCTAGFPVLWANLLSAQNVTLPAFILLLVLYMVIYQLDELVIFGGAVISLKSSRVEEKHGRILKLIGGMLMLTLAVVMLVNPSLMNNLGSSLIIFGAAFLATLLVLFIHRFLLPKLGIRIGTELDPKP